MKNLNIEFKVGMFVLSAIAIFFVIIFQIGGVDFFSAGKYDVHVVFDFVNGIEKSAPVHVSGVPVGTVNDVQIFYNQEQSNTQVRVSLKIKKDVKIPEDSIVYINTLGVLGEKFVEIVVGKDSGNILKDGDCLIGRNPVQLEKLTESLVDVVADQTVKNSLRQSFYNVKIATENLLLVSESLKQVSDSLTQGKGTLGKFINDDSIYLKTEKMVIGINKQLSDLITDLKKHPWKLLRKPPRARNKSTDEQVGDDNQGYIYQK